MFVHPPYPKYFQKKEVIFSNQLYGCRKVERNVSSERLKHNPSVIKGV